MSVFKPRLAWHSQEASKTSLTKVQFRKGCCTSISPLLLSKTDWANCLSHSLVTSFFSINELRHSYPYRDSFVPHVRVFTSHVTHSLYIPLPSLVDIVFQIFSGIADSSNRNFWIPESRLSWIGRHSTLLSFDCEESLKWLLNAFYLRMLGTNFETQHGPWANVWHFSSFTGGSPQ